MMAEAASVFETIEHNADVPTWFGVGGGADALVRPRSEEELTDVLHAFASERVRVLGDGANLLVADEGVDGIVVHLGAMGRVEILGESALAPVASDPAWEGEPVAVRVEAGANLPKLIVQTVREGLAGLEGLAGIPATVGGAVRMNAGGAFGEIGSRVQEVCATTYLGGQLVIPSSQMSFGYRSSGIEHAIVTSVTLQLTRVREEDRPALREKLKEAMAYKKASQPMAEKSAGCVFKNPLVKEQRISAGMLIDEARCKGLRVGGATVSGRHANFIVTDDTCTAAHILELMERVREKVRAEWGVNLEREVVCWSRRNATVATP